MNFTCNECNDSGSRDKLGTYLDCNACGTAATRRDLNDFVKSLGPTHPEDVALAIHQRALAMAPKKEAPAQEPVAWRYEWASYITGDGPQNFKLTFDVEPPPEWAVQDGQARNVVQLYAAPAAANGALTDEHIKEICESTGWIPEWNDRDHIKFARAIIAAAGPDAALVKALEDIAAIEDKMVGGDWEEIDEARTIARAALSGAKGN